MNSLIDTMPLCVSYRNVQERGESKNESKNKTSENEGYSSPIFGSFYKERQ